MSTNSFGVPVGDLVRRFFSGWIYELQALVPEKICRALREDARRLCIVIRETGYEIQAGRGLGAPQTSRIVLAHGDLNEIGQILQSEMRRWGPLLTVSVRVPTFACLARVRSLPKASLREADSLLLIELEHSTPFKSEDVFWGWHPISTPSKEPIVIEQLIFKRSRIASLIDALSKFKLHLVAIEVEDEDNHLLPVNLWPREQRISYLELALRRAIAISFCGFVLLTVLAVGLYDYRYETALSALQVKRDALTKQAAMARRRLAEFEAARSQLAQVRTRKAGTPQLVEVWEEVTKKLPDTAWVTDFGLDENFIVIDGLAQSASELIRELAASQYFKEVTFASPVVRDPQRDLERFQIRARIYPAAKSSASTSSP